MDMNDYAPHISAEPVGFIVYLKKNGSSLSLAQFCKESGMEVLEVMKILTASSGFKPEPDDALGFFLFEDNAKRFVQALEAA